MLAPALKRLVVHAAREQDLAAVFAMVEFEKPKNPWIEKTGDLLKQALADPKGEYKACVAERDAEVVGVGIYGRIAGAVGTGVLHSVLVAPRSRRAGIGQRIVQHVAEELTTDGARMIVAEIPADPAVMRYRALLLSYGFVEESRIDDYYRDGVAQIISRFEL